LKHYSVHTAQVYVDRIRRHILFHDKRQPKGLGVHTVQTCGEVCLPFAPDPN
jgi:hypothetical protein